MGASAFHLICDTARVRVGSNLRKALTGDLELSASRNFPDGASAGQAFAIKFCKGNILESQ